MATEQHTQKFVALAAGSFTAGLAGCSALPSGDDGPDWDDIFEVQVESFTTEPRDDGSHGYALTTRNVTDDITVARVVWEVSAQTDEPEVFFTETVEATDVAPGDENSWFIELSEEQAQKAGTYSYGAEELELESQEPTGY